MWYFDRMSREPDYEPRILHYCGSLPFKPQAGRYPVRLRRFQKEGPLGDLRELKPGQVKYYERWYEYALGAERLLEGL